MVLILIFVLAFMRAASTGVETCVGYGIEVLKRGGVFIQAGLGPTTIQFTIAEICNKEATFKGSYRYGPGDDKQAIELLESGKVKVKDLISHRYDFWEAEQAFINISNRPGIKSIIYGPSASSNSIASMRHRI